MQIIIIISALSSAWIWAPLLASYIVYLQLVCPGFVLGSRLTSPHVLMCLTPLVVVVLSALSCAAGNGVALTNATGKESSYLMQTVVVPTDVEWGFVLHVRWVVF